MVVYTGRSRQRTRGNTNQNLKMSGTGSGVGRTVNVRSAMSIRVVANLRMCKDSEGNRCKEKTKSACGDDNKRCRMPPCKTAQATRGIGSRLLI